MTTGEGVQRKCGTYFEMDHRDCSELCKWCWTYVSFFIWRKEWRGLNWDGLSLEPWLKPGAGPKYSAVRVVLYGVSLLMDSSPKSLQWKLPIYMAVIPLCSVGELTEIFPRSLGSELGGWEGCKLMAVSRSVTNKHVSKKRRHHPH